MACGRDPAARAIPTCSSLVAPAPSGQPGQPRGLLDDDPDWDEADPQDEPDEEPDLDSDSSDVWGDWDPDDDVEPDPQHGDFWMEPDDAEDEW